MLSWKYNYQIQTVLLQGNRFALQQHGAGVFNEVGEKQMGNDKKCMMCSLPPELCGDCKFHSKQETATNALPCGHFLNNGRYRIERVLGEGGYGITYEAVDLWKRRKVAIKEFFPTFALRRGSNKTDTVCVNPNQEANLAHIRIRFNQEASLLIALKNIKEIVTVYHSFEENQTAYYTMELLQGMDMQKHLQKHGVMSWHELSPIVIQILRALYATHQIGYIHRDISPDNIFLLNNGTVQLIDFGNARRYKENQPLTEIVKDKFAPREQYNRKGNQGPWTDIYSLCVTIYYAMTAKLPKKATELNVGEATLPPLHTMVDVPMSVSHALMVGMSADENNRYQSVADFAYAMFPGQAILGDITRQFLGQATVSKDGSVREPKQQQFQMKQSVTMPAQLQGELLRKPVYQQNEIVRRGKVVPMLICTQGIMKGFRLNLSVGQVQSIGRGQGKIIRYPDGSTGISRNQCSILLHTNGTVYAKDDGSRYGTTVNGQILSGTWRPLKHGDTIIFGREMYILY